MKRQYAALAATLALSLAGALFTPNAALAFDETSTASTNLGADRLALHGYDPVAYFTSNVPTLGDAGLAVTHDGAVYHFASAANMKAFQANPAQYVPQYGGFCAMGAALGKKFDIDPTQFKVVDGRLYLNKDPDVAVLWNKDVAGNIDKADASWPAIAEVAPEAL